MPPPATAFREFLAHQGLATRIAERLRGLDVDDVEALARAGAEIRRWLTEAPLPPALEEAIRVGYAGLTRGAQDASFAVRSSATAEDLPDASFAGQQETFLNINGIDNILRAIREVFASLYNDRAIAYRVHKGFAHADVALSAGVQRMVRSDLGAAGVMFTLDTESGFDQVVFITAAYGLGETVVQGAVNPDEFYVDKRNRRRPPRDPAQDRGRQGIADGVRRGSKRGKSTVTEEVSAAERVRFSITDAEAEALGRAAMTIERHYGRPMDIEWGRDGQDQELYILQARPETVKSQEENADRLRRYRLKGTSAVLATGRAIGQKIGQGPVRLIRSASEMARVQPGDVLVTEMTDPDWEPVMKRAAAIVTNRGGRTCHAAIIARELGIPAVVGCGDATRVLAEDDVVTVSCAEGDTGHVYAGLLEIEIIDIELDRMPPSPTKIMMNVATPSSRSSSSACPMRAWDSRGWSSSSIAMSASIPRRCSTWMRSRRSCGARSRRASPGTRDRPSSTCRRLPKVWRRSPRLSSPKKVIVRLSDFKSNEYKKLLGGERYEPHEENPMLGFRGASRYIAPEFYDCFALECAAMKRCARHDGLHNVEIMIPFVRTTDPGVARHRASGRQRLAPRGKRPARHHDVRTAVQRHPGRALSRALRWLLDRLQRHDTADRWGWTAIPAADRHDLRRARRRRQGDALARDQGVPEAWQVRRHPAARGRPTTRISRNGWSSRAIESMSLNPDTVVETWLALARGRRRKGREVRAAGKTPAPSSRCDWKTSFPRRDPSEISQCRPRAGEYPVTSKDAGFPPARE